MAPRVKLTASMAVAVAATELTFWILSHILSSRIGWRLLLPSVVCDFALVYMLKYITEYHYSVRRWQEAVKLSLLVSAFYTLLTAPSVLYSFTAVLYLIMTASNIFIPVVIMLLCLVYVKY